MEDVAQFVFTALPDSYAARTGRPGNVGVIGVAVYRERAVPAADRRWRRKHPHRGATNRARSRAKSPSLRGIGEEGGKRVGNSAGPPRPAPWPNAAPTGRTSLADARVKSMKLGTGHGRREHSPTRYTEFVRHSDTPDEIVTIYYDSRANLLARGIIPSPRLAEPRPFPANSGFVPDPRG
jgi:hypothetical protein